MHRAPYDFPRLIAACPELASFVQPHPLAGDTIDFADPAAVLTLNRALLKLHYGVERWTIPAGYLCPPIPSRADYLHTVADLLATGGEVPRGAAVRVLDVGTGANLVYPLIGTQVYGWSFVGTEVDAAAVEAARATIAANPGLSARVEVRLQRSPQTIFGGGVVAADERFALSICNPPFHASSEEATAGTLRKLRNLGGGRKPAAPVLNFGGRSHELWCEGGEVAFVQRMIAESAARPALCGWFTTLVSKSGNLPAIERALTRVSPAEIRTLVMFAGQKQSRVLAWRFPTKP